MPFCLMSTPFLLSPENALAPLTRTAYDSEDLFQRLLADHPALLQEIAGADGRLVLVTREAPVPDATDGGARWSLDHLFLDRDGVPVLVEVKRASDTRVRREVVAQMLDYAANGVAYWPLDMIQAGFAGAARQAGEEADSRLAAFLDGGEAEPFWRQVEANLRSGRIRMVFVADAIPKELRRIVEFLNEQMRPAEVLALEVEQHTTPDGMRLLTPRLVGKTERAETAKSVAVSPAPITIEEWLASLRPLKGAEVEEGARKLVGWFQVNGFRTGATQSHDALAASLAQADGRLAWPFFIRRSSGQLQTALQYLQYVPAFEGDEVRADLLRRLQAVPGARTTTTKATGWPGIALEAFMSAETFGAWSAIALEIKAKIEAKG